MRPRRRSEGHEEDASFAHHQQQITALYLEVDPCRDREQCGRPGLGQGSGLGLGLWTRFRLGLGLEPGASRSAFLLGAPSASGVFTSTSLSTRPESNLCCSGRDEEEGGQAGSGGRLGPGAAGPGGGSEEGAGGAPDGGESCFSNQSGFWPTCWCMLQMATYSERPDRLLK